MAEKKKRTARLLSFNRRSLTDENHETTRLIECAFIAGVCHDTTSGKHSTFSREHYPTQYVLPAGIEELCFPDASRWLAASSNFTNTYSIVLTSPDGQRNFCYCKRIQPEGDAYCLPLAVCLLTRHKDRITFAKILTYLTAHYGCSEPSLPSLFRHLYTQTWPDVGGSIPLGPDYSFTRPVDPRFGGARICNLISTQHLLLLYSHLILERKVVILSSNPSHLSICLDAIDSLLVPFVWQHALIPVLPFDKRGFLEAPTPFLIGVLVEKDKAADVEKFYKAEIGDLIEGDDDCLALSLGGGDHSSKVLKKPSEVREGLPTREILAPLTEKLRLMSKSKRKYSENGENKARFILICECLSRGMRTILSGIDHQPAGKRHFNVEQFLTKKKSSCNSDVYTFITAFAQTAMFGDFVRKTLTE